jgi:hypothetical protein
MDCTKVAKLLCTTCGLQCSDLVKYPGLGRVWDRGGRGGEEEKVASVVAHYHRSEYIGGLG